MTLIRRNTQEKGNRAKASFTYAPERERERERERETQGTNNDPLSLSAVFPLQGTDRSLLVYIPANSRDRARDRGTVSSSVHASPVGEMGWDLVLTFAAIPRHCTFSDHFLKCVFLSLEKWRGGIS